MKKLILVSSIFLALIAIGAIARADWTGFGGWPFGLTAPTAGQPLGVKNGSTFVALTADSSSNLNVNCAVGCAAGQPGQQNMAGSSPVVIASNQSAVPASQSGAWTVGVSALPAISLAAGNNNIGDVDVATLPAISGTVSVSNFPVTQPVSGTIAATQSGTWNIGSITTLPSLVAGNANIGDVDVATLPAISGTVSVSNFPATQAVTQSGTWTVQPGNTANTTPWLTTEIPNAAGGLTKFKLQAAASTNATVVKASAGKLYHIAGYGISATPAWITFYNTAGAPTCGTSVVYETIIPGPAGGGYAVDDIPSGLDFSTGIAICVTTAIAGTGNVAANVFVVNLGYK